MATPALAPTSQVYVRAAMTAALEALYAGLWVAAGELPTGKRRAARVAMMAATAAVGAVKERSEPAEQPDPAPDEKTSAAEKVTDRMQSMSDAAKRRLATKFVLTVTAGTVLSVARRRLRNRWLTGLSGNPHPHRALAVRMTALTFVVSLTRRVITAVESRREASQSQS